MNYRVIKEDGIFGIPFYVPQEFSVEDNEWHDLEWGCGDYYREWALTLDGAKRKIREWEKANREPEVVWKEEV